MNAIAGLRTDTDARTLVIERTFDAPRALVWEAWTKREHMLQWSCPHGFRITECDGDVRPGGAWRSCMVSPEGTEHRNGGVYKEVAPPERLVFTFAWKDETGKPGHETLCTVTLKEEGGKTRMTFRQEVFESVSSRDGHADGWSQSFERLAAYAPTIAVEGG